MEQQQVVPSAAWPVSLPVWRALTIPGIGPILAAGPIAAGLTGVATGGIAAVSWIWASPRNGEIIMKMKLRVERYWQLLI